MATIARIAAASALLLASCASSIPTKDLHAPDSEVVPVLPASTLPRMTSEASVVGTDDLTSEVTRPEGLHAVLAGAGFQGGVQRAFGGGAGAFSRVVARGLRFDSEAGAAAFVAWFDDHAPQEFLSARRIAPDRVADEVVVFHHRPDGCCHNDVPVFLAAWQRGSTVLFLHAGGRRARVRAFADLIESFDRAAG
jgi:hypothetical protein